MDQNVARKSFEEYISHGVKVRYIAEQLGIHEAILSMWRKNKRNLPKKHYLKLVNYVLNKKAKL